MTSEPASGTPRARPQPRTAARIAGVQGLYQMDIAGADINAVISEFTQLRFGEEAAAPETSEADDPINALIADADPVFFAELLRGVVRRQRDIDPLIDQQLAAGWRLTRVDSLLRAILRSGVFELMERREVPARVVINEYLDVAHAFLPDEEKKVVNGVLDKLARRLRADELPAKE